MKCYRRKTSLFHLRKKKKEKKGRSSFDMIPKAGTMYLDL